MECDSCGEMDASVKEITDGGIAWSLCDNCAKKYEKSKLEEEV